MPRADWQAAEREFSRRMSADERLAITIAIRLALRDTPWTLLTGAEKGRRPRDEEERRTARLAAKVIELLTLARRPE